MSAVNATANAAPFAGDPRLNPFHDRLKVEEAAMLLIDHQEGFFPGIKSIDAAELRNNIVALGELAAATGMPTVLTSSFAEGINGPLIHELTDLFPDLPVINRHLVNCWDDPRYVAAVKMTSWVTVGAELLYDHLGPHKKPIQQVFDRHLFGYSAEGRENGENSPQRREPAGAAA